MAFREVLKRDPKHGDCWFMKSMSEMNELMFLDAFDSLTEWYVCKSNLYGPPPRNYTDFVDILKRVGFLNLLRIESRKW